MEVKTFSFDLSCFRSLSLQRASYKVKWHNLSVRNWKKCWRISKINSLSRFYLTVNQIICLLLLLLPCVLVVMATQTKTLSIDGIPANNSFFKDQDGQQNHLSVSWHIMTGCWQIFVGEFFLLKSLTRFCSFF